jgi:hypothetical protein
MKNNRMKTRLNVQYIQFVPHREQHAVMSKSSWRRHCWYMAVAYIVNCTHSNGNPNRRVLGSVVVEI